MPSSSIDLPFVLQRQSKVLMVIDVVESVRLMEQDEDGFVRRWQDFVQQAEQRLLPLHGGRLVKSLGDGLMLEFPDAQSCIKTAFALQELGRLGNGGRPEEQHMHLRVGAHLAEFVADRHDIYGAGVNLTARIATLAGPDEIVVTAEVRDGLTAGLDADVEDLGECYLKHVKEPVRGYRVGPVGQSPVVPQGAGPQPSLKPSISIIPFTCRTNEPGHDILGEVLADEIIASISRTPAITVISRLTTTAFRAREASQPDITEYIDTGYILSGAYRIAGDRLTLVAELTHTSRREVLWSESIKGSVHAIMNGDDPIVTYIVTRVSESLIDREMQRATTAPFVSLESATLLLGAINLTHRTQLSDFNRARQMLEVVVERHRRHSSGYAWLASWHVFKVTQGWFSDLKHESDMARGFASKALDIAPNDPIALTMDGLVHTNLVNDFDIARQRYERALSINPNESLAWLHNGMLHAFAGEGMDAFDQTQRALQLSPLDPWRYYYDSLAASAAVAAGRYEEAIQLGERSFRANRTHLSTLRVLAISYAQVGRTEEARKYLQAVLKYEPHLTVTSYLARSPSRGLEIATICANALRAAGLPE